MRKSLLALAAVLMAIPVLPHAQATRPAQTDAVVTVLKPARVFDGDTMHEGWAVRVKGERIDAVGPAAGITAPGGAGNDAARVVDLPGTTLMPGMVEGHSHVLLHAYSE